MENILRAPRIVTINGEVVKVKAMEAEAYGKFSVDMVIVSIAKFDEDVIDLWLTQVMFDSFEMKPVLFVGNIVSIACNENVKDETYFIDADGDEQPHEKDWLEVVGAYHCASITMAKNNIPEFLINKVNDLRADQHLFIELPKKFYAGKADADTLIEKYDKSTNPIYKDGIAKQLNKLGYSNTNASNTWCKEPDEAN